MYKIALRVKPLFIDCVFVFILTSLYAEDCILKGNAHILSKDVFKTLINNRDEGKLNKFSATEFYDIYAYLYSEFSDNDLLLQEKLTACENNVFFVYGYVNCVRRSILDEYIVELKINHEGILFHLSVVFPEKISSDQIKKLTRLKKGDYFESIAISRRSGVYVDVPVWNNNGIYETEL